MTYGKNRKCRKCGKPCWGRLCRECWRGKVTWWSMSRVMRDRKKRQARYEASHCSKCGAKIPLAGAPKPICTDCTGKIVDEMVKEKENDKL